MKRSKGKRMPKKIPDLRGVHGFNLKIQPNQKILFLINIT
jgi:hypothetical protein